MTVRLAFAVAAHLEPEILIIDEVLAVGDAAFQKRCLRKMEGVAKEGRTILFVSHNMTAVQTLCQRVIWLDEGRIAGDGRPSEVVSAYLRMSTATLTDQYWEDRISAPGNDKVRFRRIRIRPQYGSSLDSITVETPFVMEFEYWNLDPGALLNLSLVLYNEQSTAVFNTGPASEAVWHGQPFPSGLFRSACHVPGHLLNDGTHRILLLVVKNQTQIIYRHDDAIVFEVVDVPRTNDAWYGKFPGVVRPDLKWTTELLESDVALKA
jgi:lipopolysaccharide transport system ATP-binding protein